MIDMRKKKVVHHVILPASIRNDWPHCLKKSGLSLDPGGRFPAVGGAPSAFERLWTVVRDQDARVHLSCGYDEGQNGYRLSMLIPVVERDLPLAMKVESALVHAGAVPLSNELERLQDMVAGRPPRQLVEATDWPRAEGQ